MITITVYGGIGNQLFQLFSLLAYKYRQIEKNSKREVFLFRSLLSCKRLNSKGKYSEYWDTPLFAIFNDLFHSNEKNIDVSKFRSVKWIEPIYVSFEDHISSIPEDESVFLQGCFQSFRYFENEKMKIFQDIGLDDIKDKIKIKHHYDYENIVSLHFRIGDYVQLPDYHPLLSIDYYLRCLEQLKKDTQRKNWIVLYFYEKQDEEYVSKIVRELMSDNFQMLFLPIDHDILDWEQMLIMSLCSHNIIANSTFSWWGAYFGKQDGRKVYYPNRWHGPLLSYIDTKMLFPESWTRIA